MLYEEAFRAFESAGIRYLVAGGVAVNLHGYARLTVDLDLMLDLAPSNLSRAVDMLQRLGYTPRAPVDADTLLSKEARRQWQLEKGALVFTFVDPKAPFRNVDLFLENPVDFEQAYQQRRTFEIQGISVPVASIETLIQMKSATGRPRDEEDIHHLRQIQKENGR